MKILILVVAIVLLYSCVSVKKYEVCLTKFEKNSSMVKALEEELKQLKKEKSELKNTIASELKALNSPAEKIRRRLLKYGIESRMSDQHLSGLRYDYFTKRDQLYKNEYIAPATESNPDTARNFNWLTAKEKDTYYWLNYARLYPKDFCDKYVVPLLDGGKEAENPYLITLIDYLYRMKPLPVLVPDRMAYESAKCHSVSCGDSGFVGHERVNGCKSDFYGECCSYGDLSARDHVINLLVDEDVLGLGHRNICLGFYRSVGIAYAKHISYGENVVLDFK